MSEWVGLIGENDFFPFYLSVKGRFFLITPGDLPLFWSYILDLRIWGDGEKESCLGFGFAGGVKSFNFKLIGLR